MVSVSDSGRGVLIFAGSSFTVYQVLGLVTGAMFFFMYYFLVTRYAVQPSVIMAVTICWLLVICLAYWVYVVRIKKASTKKRLKKTNDLLPKGS